jgi:hypothetical protein
VENATINNSPVQLEFVWRDEESLRAELEERTGLQVQLVVTDNTATVLSVRHDDSGRGALLRLHHMFLGASPQIMKALSTWMLQPGRRSSGAKIDQFIRDNHHLIRERKPRVERMVTRGRCHSLRPLYEEVNRDHFDGAVTAAIGWGRYPTTRRRRSIRFGSYSPDPDVIRIHPLLDQDFVPRYFVRYIVFHEMLHAYLGLAESPSGRRTLYHTREFNEIERAYPDFHRAEAWQRNPVNLRRLLR